MQTLTAYSSGVLLFVVLFVWFYFVAGDLEDRAVIREPASLLITNATRSDTAKYRCEVTAPEDQKSFDEIVIDLVVRGTLIYFWTTGTSNTVPLGKIVWNVSKSVRRKAVCFS